MGLFDFLNRKSKPAAVAGDPNNAGGIGSFVGTGGQGEADPAFAAALAGGSFTAPGTGGAVAVNEHTAVTLSAVWACVRVIAESVAQLPLLVLQKTGKGSRRVAEEHPVYLLLEDEPNPRQTSFNFIELMVATCVLWGNAYALIERNSLYQPIGLHWVHPRNVSVYEYEGALWYWVVGESRPRPAADVLHVAGLGFNGITGRSVLSVMRENIELGLSAQKFGTNFFNNGANIGGVLETAGKISDKPGAGGEPSTLEKLRRQFASNHGGLQNSHKPLILEEGMTYKRVGMPPADAQFIETRQVQAEEIARAFRVPQHKIGMLARSTNNNIEQQGLEFVTDTLGPWLVRIEKEFKRKLLRYDEKRTHLVKFNYDGLLRGDFTARANFYKALWGMGAMSANDICDMEDRNHVPGGEERFVPLNMVPTRLIEQVLMKPAAKAPKNGQKESDSTEKEPQNA